LVSGESSEVEKVIFILFSIALLMTVSQYDGYSHEWIRI